MSRVKNLSTANTNIYRNRWVAVVQERVVGVGISGEQAYRAAKQSRPKDTPQLYFVDAEGNIKNTDIHRAMLNLNPESWLKNHALLRQTTEILRAQQIESYLVGGAVRDFLLKRPNIIDLDFVLPGNGLTVARQIANALDAAFYPLDSERGTGRVVCKLPAESGPIHFYLDFASYRGKNLNADLLDRDFTINAIALNLNNTLTLVDPANGCHDLENGQIKAPSPSAFRRDPVRVVRAVRQAVDFSFAIEAQTMQLIQQAASLLPLISPERQRDELLKLLNTPQPGRAVQMLRQLAILPHILPEVETMAGVTQSPPHHLDVFEHTLKAMNSWAEMLNRYWPDILKSRQPDVERYFNERLAGNLTLGNLMPLAILLHDTGKPFTRTEETRENEKRIRFFSHELESAHVAAQVTQRLRLSGQAGDFVKTVVHHHLRPILLANEVKVSRRAAYRFFRDTAGKGFQAGVAVALHALADHRAIYPAHQGKRQRQQLLKVIHQLLSAYFEQRQQVIEPPALLTGRDLIGTLGIKEGRLIGQLLNRLKEAQAAGQVHDKTAAIAFVKTDPDFILYQTQQLSAEK